MVLYYSGVYVEDGRDLGMLQKIYLMSFKSGSHSVALIVRYDVFKGYPSVKMWCLAYRNSLGNLVIQFE